MTGEPRRLAHAVEADPSFHGLIGVGRCETTPEAGIYSHNWGSARHDTADSIHKPLYATALSLRTSPGGPPCVLAVIDYCWFTTHRALESLRQPILQRLGIEEQNFLLLLTHSHAVPHIDSDLENKPGGDKIPAYRAKLIRALNSAIDAALATAQPAVVSWGKGSSTLARTRDFRDVQSGQILCGPNPDGLADTTLMVGRVTADADGKVLATLVNYACHPVSLGGGNTSVSPDYVGSMRELLESHNGGAPCLFLHGPSGNQTPRDSYSDDPAVADRNGEILGFAALSVLQALLPPAHQLEFARIERSGAELAVWERRPYAVDGVLQPAVRRLKMPSKAQELPADVDARLRDETDPAIRTRLTRLKQYHQNFLEGLGQGFPVWGLRMGRCVLIGTPAEPFSNLQVELRKRFPQLAIVVANHTNGSFNYLPPREYFGNGAYEQDCTDYGAGALETVIEAAADMIRSLMGPDLDR